jgi:hypothetical protein
LANWTPDGFIGRVFKTIGKYLPLPAGARSPALWGSPSGLAELFASHEATVQAIPRTFVLRYRSSGHWLEVFRAFYGPVLKAFAALNMTAQAGLQRDLLMLVERFNHSGDRYMVVPSEYLEIVITRK